MNVHMTDSKASTLGDDVIDDEVIRPSTFEVPALSASCTTQALIAVNVAAPQPTIKMMWVTEAFEQK
jgi:hypothetical protein